jgi:hypothetical protein
MKFSEEESKKLKRVTEIMHEDPEAASELLKETLRPHGIDPIVCMRESQADHINNELAYYKELARMWEVACHDFRARGHKNDDPESYSLAVAYQHDRLVLVKETTDGD